MIEFTIERVRPEDLAKEGTVDACTQLTMVAQALRESLSEYERQGKDGRNVEQMLHQAKPGLVRR
jgi:hypothetical protein